MLAPVPRPDERVDARTATLALACVAAVAVASALFAATTPPRDAVAPWLALIAASAAALTLAALALSRAVRARGVPLGAVVMLGAAALRLGALAAPVSLSDDVHRYVWDGTLVARGHDPYASRPVDVAHLPGLGEDALERLNSPRYYSVYPPLAQAAFALCAAFQALTGAPATLTLRALFTITDLLAIGALLSACARLGRSRIFALLYAWHPLAYWEVAAGGHTEALMLPLVLFALMAALEDRALRAGALLGAAASVKLTALVLGPALFVFLLRRGGPRGAAPFALAAPAVLLATFAPFASPTLWPHLSESLALYSRTFSFDAPVYYGARFLLGYREGWSEPVDPLLVPALGAATLACVTLLALAQDGGPRRLAGGLAWTYLAYLVLSRVIHPWYLLAPLALGALAGRRAVAVLALVAPLGYLAYSMGEEPPTVLLVQSAAFVLALVLERRARAPRHRGEVDRAPPPPVGVRASPAGEASLPSLPE